MSYRKFSQIWNIEEQKWIYVYSHIMHTVYWYIQYCKWDKPVTPVLSRLQCVHKNFSCNKTSPKWTSPSRFRTVMMSVIVNGGLLALYIEDLGIVVAKKTGLQLGRSSWTLSLFLPVGPCSPSCRDEEITLGRHLRLMIQEQKFVLLLQSS